jgi:hypothetical protein
LHFAIIEDQDGNIIQTHAEATERGLRGKCRGCKSTVTAVISDDSSRINHWRHLSKADCDKWWENETVWHREWKNHFPKTWQEYRFEDDITDEWHIADLYTHHCLVVEFQHSYLYSEERDIREAFYNNMFWVVDGTRLKRDYKRFEKCLDVLKPTNINHLYLLARPDKFFHKHWITSSVPVLFDFKGTEPIDPKELTRKYLWGLFPKRIAGYSVIVRQNHDGFVGLVKSRKDGEKAKETLNKIQQFLGEEQREDIRNKCPLCQEGTIIVNTNRTTRENFSSCSNYNSDPKCSYRPPLCQECKVAIIARVVEGGTEVARCISDQCKQKYMPCPECDSGVVQRIIKRDKSSYFPCHMKLQNEENKSCNYVATRKRTRRHHS